MQSSEIRNQTEPSRKAELFDALSIMLQEAGSRGNSREAAYVISGVLENLSRDVTGSFKPSGLFPPALQK